MLLARSYTLLHWLLLLCWIANGLVLSLLLLKLGMRLLKLRGRRVLVRVSVAVIFVVPLSNRKKNLARLVAQFLAAQSQPIIVKHVEFRLLSFLRRTIVNKEVRAVFCICLSLLHPDGSYPSILSEDLLNVLLAW